MTTSTPSQESTSERGAFLDNLSRFSVPLAYVIGVLLALAVGIVVLLLLNVDASAAISGLFEGSIGSSRGLAETLTIATPIALTALAVVIPFRAKLLNIGGEGQLLVGALAGVWVGLSIPEMPVIGIILAMLAGAAGGLAWAFVPAIGKAKLGVNEVVTTILLNFVAFLFVQWAITNPLREEGGFFPQTDRLPDSVLLPNIIQTFRLHVGSLIALPVVLIVAYVLTRSDWGYRLRIAGEGGELSSYLGINRIRLQMTALLLGGALAGLAGIVQVLGVQGRLIEGFSPGYGFDGVVAAFLGRGKPLPSAIAAIALGALRAGGQNLQLLAQVPISVVLLFEAILIITTLAIQQLIGRGLRATSKSEEEN